MNLSPVLRQYWTNANGQPLVGGLLFSYQAGTTTPQATYTDQSGVTPNTNPIVLDANGSAAMWLDPSLSYKFVLQDSVGVTQWTVDNVVGILTGNSVNTNAIQDGAVIKQKLGSDVRDYVISSKSASYTVVNEDLILCDASGSAFSITLPSAATFKKPIVIKKVDAFTAYSVTVSRGGTDTIEGATSVVLSIPNEFVTLVSDGVSKWYVKASKTPFVGLRYTNSASSVISSGTVIPFATSDFDTHSAWSGSNTFTAPSAGKYELTVGVQSTQFTPTAGNVYGIDLKKNGTMHSRLSLFTANAAVSQFIGLWGTALVDMAKGDTLILVGNISGSITLYNDPTFNYVLIWLAGKS